LDDASRMISELSEMDLKGETINLGGLERVTRFELGEMLCSITSLDKNLLEKITTEEIPNYPKVEDVSLNTDKFQSFGLKLRTIEENIAKIIRGN
jgi:dTDP-4-dehydrorhamnose reductase